METYELLSAMEEFAPLKLSDEFVKTYGGYDNSGVIVPLSERLKGVVFSLDLTFNAVAHALSNGANVLVTHHPAIYNPVKKLDGTSALYLAVKSGIGVISYHLNLDCAKHGIDYYLAEAAGAKDRSILMPLKAPSTGYGSLFGVEKTTVENLAEKLKTALNTEKICVYGKDKTVTSVASFCGAGFDEEAFSHIYNAGVVISADIPHHMLLAAAEKNVSVINLTHYASEFYGFKKFAETIIKKLKITNGEVVKDELFL